MLFMPPVLGRTVWIKILVFNDSWVEDAVKPDSDRSVPWWRAALVLIERLSTDLYFIPNLLYLTNDARRDDRLMQNQSKSLMCHHWPCLIPPSTWIKALITEKCRFLPHAHIKGKCTKYKNVYVFNKHLIVDPDKHDVLCHSLHWL